MIALLSKIKASTDNTRHIQAAFNVMQWQSPFTILATLIRKPKLDTVEIYPVSCTLTFLTGLEFEAGFSARAAKQFIRG